MAKTKILCVYDGGITKEIMSAMYGLEKYDAEVVMVEDTDMVSMAEITDRMGLLEKGGIDAAPDCQNLLDACEDADVIAVHCASINRHVIDKAKNLKVAAVLRGGYENADVPYLTEKKIPLINAPWRSAEAVSDFAVGMMIAENKNIARSHKLLMEGKWCKKYVNQNYIHNMKNCTVGLIGYGYIGSRVCRKLKGFGCRIIVHDPFANEQQIKLIQADGVEHVDLDTLLRESDFVSLHLRQSELTHHFMGKEEFAKMKETAYFINTARPLIVDTDALVEALKNRSIGGAAIDVYDEEPLSADHPYLQLDNITITPHIAGTSSDTMAASVEIGYEELELYLQGKPMRNIRNL